MAETSMGCEVALVVGAAGSSGGNACRWLAERGYRVIAADYDSSRLGQLRRELGITARFCDVASSAGVAILHHEVLRNHGIPRVLVNAAGPGWLRTLAMVRLCKAFLPALRERAEPAFILNVESARVDALFPNAGSPRTFAATAAAISDQLRDSCVVAGTAMAGSEIEALEEATRLHLIDVVGGDRKEVIAPHLDPLASNKSAA